MNDVTIVVGGLFDGLNKKTEHGVTLANHRVRNDQLWLDINGQKALVAIGDLRNALEAIERANP